MKNSTIQGIQRFCDIMCGVSVINFLVAAVVRDAKMALMGVATVVFLQWARKLYGKVLTHVDS